VTWIAARGTLLFTVFYLSALIVYLRYLDSRQYKHIILTLLLFLLALFSKAMAMTLPLVLVLIDLYKQRKTDWRFIIEKIPFLILSVIFGIVSIKAASTFGHLGDLSADYTLPERFLIITHSLSMYIVKAIFPFRMSAIYAFPYKEDGILSWEYYASPLIILALAALVIFVRKFRKEWIFGIAFFILTISVVMPVFFSRVFTAADRYSYLTFTGLFFLMGWMAQIATDKSMKLFKYRIYLFGFLSVMAVYYLAANVKRTKVWEDTFILLTDVVQNSRNPNAVSAAFFYRGNFKDMAHDFDGAMSDYTLAVKLKPDYMIAYNNRGIVKGIRGDFEGAKMDFNKALELQPGYVDALYNRGLVYYQLNQPDSACNDLRRAHEMGFPRAKEMLGKYCK
jgi:tetratricopeptide (TPR) repeat protein